jgi:hypothetical protein
MLDCVPVRPASGQFGDSLATEGNPSFANVMMVVRDRQKRAAKKSVDIRILSCYADSTPQYRHWR